MSIALNQTWAFYFEEKRSANKNFSYILINLPCAFIFRELIMKKFLFMLASAGFLAGCSRPDKIDGNNRLIYMIAAAPGSLDPTEVNDLFYYQIVFNIFETLITVNWRTGAFEPALAMQWNYDSSQTSWTFNLRRGVRFHDGSPLNAGAVKISFERQIVADGTDKKNGLYGRQAFAMIREIRAVNDSTVQFMLKYPHAAFLDHLASPYYSTIASQRGLETHAENFGRHPVGTGPFEFVRWDTAGQIVLKKFSQYWESPPPLDSIIYKVVESLDEKIKALRQGRADVISGLSAASVSQFYSDTSFRMVEEASLATAILGMKLRQPPFNHAAMRQAVAHAIDKNYLAVNVSRNLAIPAHGPLSPLLAFYDSTLAVPEYDTVRAKILLQQAGAIGPLPVKLAYCIDTDNRRGAPLVQTIKHNLQMIGVQTEILPYSNWQKYEDEVLRGGAAELFIYGNLSFTRHPGDFLYSLFYSKSPNNFFNYKNPEVDRLLDQAQRTVDIAAQRRLYRRVQEIVLQETPAVFFNHPKMVCATRAWVKNFSIGPRGIPNLKGVTLNKRRND